MNNETENASLKQKVVMLEELMKELKEKLELKENEVSLLKS